MADQFLLDQVSRNAEKLERIGHLLMKIPDLAVRIERSVGSAIIHYTEGDDTMGDIFLEEAKNDQEEIGFLLAESVRIFDSE